MLCKDPTKRISIKQALNDPWLLKHYTIDVSASQLSRVLSNMSSFKPTMKL